MKDQRPERVPPLLSELRLIFPICVFVLAVLCPVAVFSQAGGAGVIPQPRDPAADFPPWNDPLVSKLGYRISQAIEELGSPQELSVVRGQEPWQDDVVFYYPDHSYLYWWNNRLWQIRYDFRHEGEIMGVQMGQSMESVTKTLGKPFVSDSTQLVYQLPDRGFPVRLRLIFKDAQLSDLYLYRADF